LLDLTALPLIENPTLSNYTGFVQDSGEGRWPIMAAIEEAVPADGLSTSLYARFGSRQEHTYQLAVSSDTCYVGYQRGNAEQTCMAHILQERGECMDRFPGREWSLALKELEMQQEYIRSIRNLPLQELANNYNQAKIVYESLRASSILDSLGIAAQPHLQSRLNVLQDLVSSTRLSAEMDAAKQAQVQYEQSRLPAEVLGLQQAAELMAAQEQLRALTSSAALNIMREVQERYNNVRSFTELSNLAAMVDLSIHAVKAGYIDQYFTRTFAGSVLDSLTTLQGYQGYSDFATHLDRIERLIEERIQSNSHGLISFEGILGIFVDVLLFVIGLILSNQSDNFILGKLSETTSSIERQVEFQYEEFMGRFESFKNQCMDRLDAINPEVDNRIFYVSRRTINVRSDSNKKSSAIGKIYKNNKVALIKSQGEWLYIEYFDYIIGISKMGGFMVSICNVCHREKNN
jgi:hypothetical protein